MGQLSDDHAWDLISEAETVEQMKQRTRATELSGRERLEVGLVKKWAAQDDKSRHN